MGERFVQDNLVSFLFLGATAFGLLLAFILRNRSARSVKFDGPIVTQNGQVDCRKQIVQAFENYPDRVFQLELTGQEVLVVPPKYLPEIAHLPETRASIYQDLVRMFEGKYTGYGTILSLPRVVQIIKSDILRHTGSHVALIRDEVEPAIATTLGSPENWTSFTLSSTVAFMVARVVSRVFVGAPLCRNPEWLSLVMGHPKSLKIGAVAIASYPRWLRPFVAPFLKEIRYLDFIRKRLGALLAPVLQERSSKLAAAPDSELPSDLIAWTIKESEGKAWDPIIQAEHQTSIGIAAIGSTATLMTNVICDLCTYPSYIESLRLEWQHVITPTHGEISEKSLLQLPKMDSFIRESQRLNPNTPLTINRYITSDVLLSNGQVLPRGTSTTVALFAMNFNSKIFENPDKFDGERFVSLRENRERGEGAYGGKEGPRWGALDIHAEANVNFGLGKHACPGRFLAINTIKLLLGHMLMEYEFCFENPVKGRPQTIMMGNFFMSDDPMRKVLFRKRTSVSKN